MQKQYRLKRRAAFNYVYRKGEKDASQHLVLLYAKSREGLKIGLSVSKKVGNSVVRNRVKRLLRAGLMPIQDGIDTGFMYVIVAKPNACEMSYSDCCAELESVFKRAGKLC